MLGYLDFRVLFIKKKIADVCSWCEVQNIEYFNVLWIILQQEDQVVVFEVVEFQFQNGVLHMSLQSGFLGFFQLIVELLR
jgi:hypothetical protein